MGTLSVHWPAVLSADPQGAVSHLGLIWSDGGLLVKRVVLLFLPAPSHALLAPPLHWKQQTCGLLKDLMEDFSFFFFFFGASVFLLDQWANLSLPATAMLLNTMQDNFSHAELSTARKWAICMSYPSSYATAPGEPPLSPRCGFAWNHQCSTKQGPGSKTGLSPSSESTVLQTFGRHSLVHHFWDSFLPWLILLAARRAGCDSPDICLVNYACLPESTNKLLDFLPTASAPAQPSASPVLALHCHNWDQHWVTPPKMPLWFTALTLLSNHSPRNVSM